MNHEQNEKIYFLFALKNIDLLAQISPDYFKNKYLAYLCKIAKKYHQQFNHIPDNFKKTVMRIVTDVKSRIQMTKQQVNVIFNEDVDEYDEVWLRSAVISWIRIKEFNTRLSNTVAYIKTQEITPENTENVINQTMNIFNDVKVSFSQSAGSNFLDPGAHKLKESQKIRSGRNFVDKLLGGGYERKTLICYLGQQGVGKSLFLCDDAVYFALNGYNVVYVSAEMSESSVIKRVGSMMFEKPIKSYNKWATPENVQNALEDLRDMGLNLGTLNIVQLANPTTVDIETHVNKLQKDNDIHVDVVIVDYLGIISNYRNPNSENMYLNGKMVSKDLRDAAIRNDHICITAQQIGKDSWNSTDMKIGAISESAGIAHNADLIYGIIQDDEMDLENEYYLKVLKIRDGEGRNTKCKYKRNRKTLKLKETEEVSIGK